MPEWGIALIGVAGIIVGVIITEVRNWLDRKQRFQIMTFEKRLSIHQEIASYCFKIAGCINSLKEEPQELIKNLREVITDANKYVNEHILYIDVKSLDAWNITNDMLVGFLNQGELSNELEQQVKKKLSDVLCCLTVGVGANYLPEMNKRLNL